MTTKSNRRAPALGVLSKGTAAHTPAVYKSALVFQVLNDEIWFGDTGPKWKDAPTASDALEERVFVIKRQRRFGNDFPNAEELARQLEKCTPDSRCMSAACPECLRAFQRWLAHNVSRIAQLDIDPGLDPVALSLVIPAAQAPPGSLGSISISKMKRKVRQTLVERGDVQWAVLGLDISLNDATQKGHEIVWQAQFYGFIQVGDEKALAKALLAAFPSSITVSRPVRIRKYDGSRYATSYAFKTYFVRRISYWAPNLRYPCWQTRKCALKAREHVELLLMLDDVGFKNRVLLHGLKLVLGNGGFMLKKI